MLKQICTKENVHDVAAKKSTLLMHHCVGRMMNFIRSATRHTKSIKTNAVSIYKKKSKKQRHTDCDERLAVCVQWIFVSMRFISYFFCWCCSGERERDRKSRCLLLLLLLLLFYKMIFTQAWHLCTVILLLLVENLPTISQHLFRRNTFDLNTIWIVDFERKSYDNVNILMSYFRGKKEKRKFRFQRRYSILHFNNLLWLLLTTKYQMFVW